MEVILWKEKQKGIKMETLDKRYEKKRYYDGTIAKLAAQTARDGLCSLYADALLKKKIPKAEEIAKVFLSAAEHGDAYAQGRLAKMLYEGCGIKKDELEAARWMRKAADQGNEIAQFNLGLMYINGLGVENDEPEAVRWFRRAAEQGYLNAQFKLGKMLADGIIVKDHSESLQWLKKAAEQGHTEASEAIKKLKGKKGGSLWRSAKSKVSAQLI